MIEFPYPPKILSPNEKSWKKKIRPRKDYRKTCGWIAKKSRPFIKFKVHIHPPDKRNRDVDNAIGSCKSLIDGLQDAWGIDDNNFIIDWPKEFSEPVKGGKITIEGVL